MMVSGALLLAPVASASLADDYRELVRKRQSLETQREAYEASLIQLSRQKKNLTTVFFQCISRQPQSDWEEKIERAKAFNEEIESMRQAMNEKREHIYRMGAEMEALRQKIEAEHTNKGPGTAYETEFRDYMEALDQTYFNALSEELFGGYEAFLERIKANIAFLKECVGQCMARKSG